MSLLDWTTCTTTSSTRCIRTFAVVAREGQAAVFVRTTIRILQGKNAGLNEWLFFLTGGAISGVLRCCGAFTLLM